MLARAAIRAIDAEAVDPGRDDRRHPVARRGHPAGPERGADDRATRPGAIEALLAAAELGGHARRADDGLSVAAIVSQVRSIAVDLLRALGTDNDDAVRHVRRAGSRP